MKRRRRGRGRDQQGERFPAVVREDIHLVVPMIFTPPSYDPYLVDSLGTNLLDSLADNLKDSTV